MKLERYLLKLQQKILIGFRNFVKQLLEKLMSDPKMIENLEFTVKEREKSIQLVKAPKTKKKKCC